MTDKQVVMQALSSLPDEATLAQITTEFLRIAMHRNDHSLFAKIYGATLTPADLSQYLNPKLEVRLSGPIAELQSDLIEKSSAAHAS